MNAKANLYGPAMEPDLHQAPEPKWPSAAASVFVWAQQQLKPAPPAQTQPPKEPAPGPPAGQAPWQFQAMARELEAAQAELNSLHALLEDIPDIFERKFEQRLQPLLAENQALRQQVLQLKQAPQVPAAQTLLPAQVLLPSFGQSRRSGFGQAIRHAFGLGLGLRSGLGQRDLPTPGHPNGDQQAA